MRLVGLPNGAEDRRTLAELEAANRWLQEELAARDHALARMEILLSAARRCLAQPEARFVQHVLLEASIEAVDAAGATVCRWDAERRVLRVVEARGRGLTPGWTVHPGQGVEGLAALRRAPTTLAVGIPGSRERRAAAAVPFIYEDELLGVLGVYAHDVERRFTDDDLGLLELLTALTATAIVAAERARLQGVQLTARTAQHELNNRLALTVGYAELLAADPSLSERSRDFAAEALRGAAEASDVVRRLGSVSGTYEALSESDLPSVGSLGDESSGGLNAQ